MFIQSGDIVKGGKQDRILSVSIMIPPLSGRILIEAFCVESGGGRNANRKMRAIFRPRTTASLQRN